jgi:hypothetical protein
MKISTLLSQIAAFFSSFRLHKILPGVVITFLLLIGGVVKSWAQFSSGNIVVLRLGDGATTLTSAAFPINLVEYTKAGVLVGTPLAMPTTTSAPNFRMTESGTASSAGALNLSADKRYLTLPGYDAAVGTTGVVATAGLNRVIARVDNTKTAVGINTTTVFPTTGGSTAYTANNMRSVVSNDGNQFWTGGTASSDGGVRYVLLSNTTTGGTQLSTTVTNTRVVNIFNGQLYVSASSGAFQSAALVGTGLPTTNGQTITQQTGLPASGQNALGYLLLDRDPAVPGVDLLYVADQSSTAVGGILKYSWNGTTWTARGSLTGTGINGTTGIIGFYNCNTSSVELYVTVNSGSNNSIYKVTDNAVYNANIQNTGTLITSAANATLLASAGANYVFRGISFAPNTRIEAPSAFAVNGGGSYCSGGAGVIVGLANSETGVTYQLYRNSGATVVGSPVNGTGSAISFGNQTTGDTYTVVATNTLTGCTVNMTGNAVVTVNNYTWTGANSTSWNDPLNWTSPCGVPAFTNDVIIATTGSNPILTGNITVNNLTINSGKIIDLGGQTLTINGAITGSGTITGSSTSNLILGGAAGTLNFSQTNASTRSIRNITFNTGATATLGDLLDVYGDIEFTPSTSNNFNVNGKNLTLKSTDTYTARIGNLTGTTLGGATNVTVERFFNLRTTGGVGTGNTGRAYRLVAPTVSTLAHATKPTMRDNWMEGVNTSTIGAISNPVPGYGLQITGPGGNGNGFDETGSNASSIYATTNGVTPTYTAVANTGGDLNPLTGYFLYVRGDRTMDMTIPLAPGTMPTSSTTLRATGIIQTGNQSAFTNGFVGGAGTLNLVTNPYPSPINWNLLYNEGGSANTTISNAYTYWDPNVGNRGGFVTVNDAGGVTNTNGGAAGGNLFIQSGQAFFVQASGVAAPALSIKETHKAAGDNDIVFFTPPPPLESFRTSLYYTETNGYRQVADGALAIFGDYKAAVDNHDAFEINNWDENIAINRNGKHLAIESRPVIVKSDELPIFMNNMKQRAYEFEFTPEAFTNTNLKAELIDNFLGTRTLLSVTAPTVVPFTITADAASKATDRFNVVFGAKQPAIVITIRAAVKTNGVELNWTAESQKDMDSYELQRSISQTDGFATINTTTAVGNSQWALSYNWLDANPKTGNNFYRIKAIDKAGMIKYTDAVKVVFDKTSPSISVSPNPVSGNTINLQLNNLQKGTYSLQVINNAGQVVYSAQLQHTGGSAIIPVTTAVQLGKGAYELVISGSDIKITTRIIKN